MHLETILISGARTVGFVHVLDMCCFFDCTILQLLRFPRDFRMTLPSLKC